MAVHIEQSFDCSHKELVTDIVRIICRHQGCVLADDPIRFWQSKSPADISVLRTAEEIFELFFGDSPDYQEE
jgi:hypothetical protein